MNRTCLKYTIALLISLIVVQLLITVSIGAVGDSITSGEAEHLVKEACILFKRVHSNGYASSVPSWVTAPVPEEYNTETKMSDYARTIYTDDIADKSWKYQLISGSEYLDYSVREDGTIELHCCPQGIHYYMPLYNMEFGKELGMNIVEVTSGTSQRAIGTAIILKHDGGIEGWGTPIIVDIEFINTENGWRISGGFFAKALTEGGPESDPSGVSYHKILPFDLLTISAALNQVIAKRGLERKYSIDYTATFANKLTVLKSEKDSMELAVYVNDLTKPAGTPAKKYTASVSGPAGSYDIEKLNIGGNFYEFLLENSGNAPQTADAELPGIILYFGSAFVSLISAAYMLNSKKVL